MPSWRLLTYNIDDEGKWSKRLAENDVNYYLCSGKGKGYGRGERRGFICVVYG